MTIQFKCCLFFLFVGHFIKAQETYWQQDLHYKINVQLDDHAHFLHGYLELDYTNNAPHSLDTIYFHLWPNAYKHNQTAFAKQKVYLGETDFYFSTPSERGYIDSLSFALEHKKIELHYHPQHPDIGYLLLPNPLAPENTIKITTPFRVKIPESFSRLGHVDQSYQMTQWYPKPAVYDKNGWNPMPYLHLGEYYGEFGTYEVQITLPQNYVVGATGTLATASEIAFLNKNVQKTSQYLSFLGELITGNEPPIPPSDPKMKTITYRAEQVHDFAWFADKRFKVQKDTVVLANNQQVETWVMFTTFEENLWANALKYVNRSIEFYSELVGPYPYPQMTAVQSALSAGAGMEYPMITVVGPSYFSSILDETITHEVGHNWFYGILGFNERTEPWLDEGLNTYYEMRYFEKYYGKEAYELVPDYFKKENILDNWEVSYLNLIYTNEAIAPTQSSKPPSENSYWWGAYSKPAISIKHFEKYLGQPSFDTLMSSFYQQWAFKHPTAADFITHLEYNTKPSISWLYDDLINSDKAIDYSIQRLQEKGDSLKLTLKNKGRSKVPFAIVALQGRDTLQKNWIQMFQEKQTFTFPKTTADRFLIDPNHSIPDINRQNNSIKTSGLFKKTEPISLNLIPRINEVDRTNLFIHPILGGNVYDGFGMGLFLHNLTFPNPKFRFGLAPAYGFRSNDLAGVAGFTYSALLESNWLNRLDLSLGIKTFHFRVQDEANYDQKYWRYAPKVTLFLKSKSHFYNPTLQYRTLFLRQERAQFNNNGVYLDNIWENATIHELSFSGKNRRPINPFEFKLALEQQQYTFFENREDYLKASVEGTFNYTYAQDQNISIRLFGGYFLNNSKRNAGAIFPGAFNLISQGSNDYRYDEFFFGRNENSGLWSQQLGRLDGAFRTPIGPGFSIGSSNNFIIAANLSADLPEGFPLKPYLDLGYFDNAMPTGVDATFEDQFLWSGGFEFEIMEGY